MKGDAVRVLVTYGSKLGGTAGIAEIIGAGLRDSGIETTVTSAAEMLPASDFDAVVVGGALYMSRWNKDARRYVKKFSSQLRDKPVWLFSSGPLDDSAAEQSIPPTWQVEAALTEIKARGHRTFGGRLEPAAKGFMVSSMAKKNAGDWRDEAQITEWAAGIAQALHRHHAA